MTHILLIYDDQSMLTFEDDHPALLLVEKINHGEWTPPAPASQLLGNLKGISLRAVVLGNWVIASLEEPQEHPRASVPIDITLTLRQREVLDLLSQGLTHKQICQKLNISQRTVNMHIANLKTKLKAETMLSLLVEPQCWDIAVRTCAAAMARLPPRSGISPIGLLRHPIRNIL